MSQLRAPGLGPIVGHTTDASACVWIRADEVGEQDAGATGNRRTIGVVAVTRENGRRPARRQVSYFRLKREYDRTGIFTLGIDTGIGAKQPSAPLAPGTQYEVRLGTLTIDDPHPDDDSIASDELAQRLPDPRIFWEELETLPAASSLAEFTTFPASADVGSDPFAFIVGSCRYPGVLWKAKHADAIFGPLLEEARGHGERSAAAFVMMAGDQIYADMLNRHVPIGLADAFEEFQDRYHTAFGSRRMRELLRQMPTYMILDDHEIEDNWTQDRIIHREQRRVFNLAINAYQSYQWIHGPRPYGKRLFYRFECGGYPFFVLDSRTTRFIDDLAGSLEDNHLLGRPSFDEDDPSQLEVLIGWLSAQQEERGNTPKFIVSPSVFAPNPIGAREGRDGTPEQRVKWKEASDSWPAFPNTRRAVLKTIVDRGVQNVVFVSGDIHCSNVAAIRFGGSPAAEALRAASITSSAFYWPFPFADGEPSNYVHDSTHDDQRDTFVIDDRHTMDYTAWNFTQEDNFCRVDVERGEHRIVVRPYGSDGDPITKGGWFGAGGTDIVSELDLVPW